MNKTPFFLGHHKCGTRYIGNILDYFSHHCGFEYFALNNPKWFGYNIRNALQARKNCIVNYMNAEYNFLKDFEDYRAFHVVRDPRDIGVSAYYSHLFSHSLDWWPELETHRKVLQGLSLRDGLLLDLDFTDKLITDGYPIGVFHSMDQWVYDDPNIFEIKFEDIIASPFEKLSEALNFIGLLGEKTDYRISILRKAIEENSFEKLSNGRKRGEVNNCHHYRNGCPGEWKEKFESVHIDWFKKKYPDLLVRLHYVDSQNW